MKRSAFGAGIKAGGPNYAVSFTQISEKSIPEVIELSDKVKSLIDKKIISEPEAKKLEFALQSYNNNWKTEFSQEKDIHNIHGEKNIFRYLPLKSMVLRLYGGDRLSDLILVMEAAKICKTRLSVSCPSSMTDLNQIKAVTKGVELIIEEEQTFLKSIDQYDRIRIISDNFPLDLFVRAAATGVYVVNAKPVGEGRVELLHYLREQSISYEYHRYGNIIEN
ncbi:hypothetical protein SDC9_114112 [bioreactor metagenome]|uniref:Uncharacterized protein n=1 Tax=bioreactor metagenome TaxID=1076179 RepID=A0A645BPI7_9ZZZZ